MTVKKRTQAHAGERWIRPTHVHAYISHDFIKNNANHWLQQNKKNNAAYQLVPVVSSGLLL